MYINTIHTQPTNTFQYREPNDENGHPYYHEIPLINNVLLEGYYQSFLFIDWCREYILDIFGLPYKMNEGVVSVHVRRGDCIGVDAFPIAPREYYQNAIKYMQAISDYKFLIFSDDIEWCKTEFVDSNYPNAIFEFSEGNTEMEDYICMQNCEHNITARSTFSLTASWLNQNPKKIVLVPTTKHRYWNSQNKDLIPNYFTQIDFENEQ